MSETDYPDKLRVDSIEAWIDWLKKHHQDRKVVWLVYKKKSMGTVPFDYQMSLDVALCYGWVDSLLKKIDEQEYMRKFTPRKASSTWSDTNKKKVEQLIKDGRMQEPGMLTIRLAKENGMWDRGIKLPEVDDSLPGALLLAFQSNPRARDHYFALKEKSRKQYNIWINMAKRSETIRKRVEEALGLLEQGKALGLK